MKCLKCYLDDIFHDALMQRMDSLGLMLAWLKVYDFANQSDEVVYEIARQWGVEKEIGYPAGATLADGLKRAIVRQRYAGTEFAVKDALNSVSGLDFEVDEGGSLLYGEFEYSDVRSYGREWYMFRIDCDAGFEPDADTIALWVQLVNKYKPCRAFLFSIVVRNGGDTYTYVNPF